MQTLPAPLLIQRGALNGPNFRPCPSPYMTPLSQRIQRRASTAGFTLVEIMAVVALMAVIAALVITSMGTADSGRLRNAANLVMDQLTLARQKAITQNGRVEVRFYQLNSASGTKVYRGLRSYVVGQDGMSKPLSPIVYLPEPIVVADPDVSPTFNSLFSTGTASKEDLPQAAQTPYRSFSFLPNGGTDLNIRPAPNAKRQWYITLSNPNATKAANNLPSNFVVLTVNEMTGTVRIIRP